MKTETKNITRVAIYSFAACIFCCIPFLQNPLLFDDFNVLTPTSLEKIRSLGFDLSPRIWVYQTFLINELLSPYSLTSYRITNLALHILNSVIIFFVCQEAKKLYPPKKDTYSLDSILVAALFAAHPLALFTQAYLVQRTILIATLSALTSIYFFLKALQGNSRNFYFSSLFCVISLYSKENTIALPLVLALLYIASLRKSHPAKPTPRQLKDALTGLLISFLAAATIILRLKGLLGSNYEPLTNEMLEENQKIAKDHIFLLSILNQTKNLFTYFIDWILPYPTKIAIDIRKPFPTNILDPSNWLYILLLIVMGLSLLLRSFKKTTNLSSFFLLASLILFSTEFAATRLQENYVIYRSYLWAPFWFIALGIFISDFSLQRLKFFLFLALLCTLLIFSSKSLVSLSNPYLAWNASKNIYEKNNPRDFIPGGYRIYYNLGTILYDSKNLGMAIDNYNKSIELNSNYPYSLINRGVAFLDLKQWNLALNDFDRAYEIDQKSLKPLIGKAKALTKLNQGKEAMAVLQEICKNSNKKTCEETQKFIYTN